MSGQEKKAIDRIVELFEMSSSLPEEVDVNLPEVQAFVQTLPEFLQNSFKAGTSDPDTRKISLAFNKGLGVYFNALRSAREAGKKIAFVPFNFGPEILYAMDMVPVVSQIQQCSFHQKIPTAARTPKYLNRFLPTGASKFIK